jgi:branched-chain amino acid transport system substrate-binding protein
MSSRLISCLLACTALVGVARAEDPAPVRITVLSDLSDDLYDARSGRGGVDATRMAVADFGGSVLGRPIIVDALNDHNKVAEAPALANQAYDAGADLLMDVENSPIATAISKIATERHKLAISTIAASPALTRAGCSKYFYHYSFNLTAITSATANYLMAQPQNKRWVMISEDTGFGKSGPTFMSPIVTAHGGEVVKSVLIPAQNTEADFSAALGDIKSANPDVVAVFDDAAKGDVGIAFLTKAGLKVTTALLYLSDVDRVKEGYAGLIAAVPWYWNLDPAARAWADRFAASHNGLRPTEAQAADYSATTQWLNAVKTAGTTDADAVIKVLDGHKFNDMFAHGGEFRAADHMVVHDLYIAKVKSPAQVTEPHDWFEILSTVPAATAFPVGTECKMLQ